MSTPIQRASLPDQAAARLKQGITAARWWRELPSEAELCRELHVSRDTVRKAIAQLVRERWITQGGRGCHHRIRKRAAARKLPAGAIVRVLTPFPLHGLGSVHHVVLDHLAERIGPAGLRIEFEHRPALFTRHHPAELKRLDTLPDSGAWLLFYATEPMQRWFAASGRPCMVIGRAHEGVALPCIYPDTQATARHAAGLFHQRGHRDLVFLIAELTSHGDRLGSAAFVEQAHRHGARAKVITHNGEPADLRRALAEILALRPRPTGFFSNCAEHCLTILGHIINAGLRVPADAAIIAGWDDEFLHYAVPVFARYRIDGAKMGRKAATMLLDLIRHGPGKIRSMKIVPEFVAGETI